MTALKFIIPAVAAVGFATPALGQLNYVSQSRSVGVAVSAPNQSPVSSSASAPDFSLFAQGVSAVVGGGLAVGQAGQTSSLTPNSFSYYGSVLATAQLPLEGGGTSAQANSNFSVTFNVSEPTGFTLTSGFDSNELQQDRQIARMSLSSVNGLSFTGGSFDEFWNVGESFTLEGLLETGINYTVSFSLEAAASEVFFLPDPNPFNPFNPFGPFGAISPLSIDSLSEVQTSGGFTFSTTTAVPETGTVMAGVMLVGLAAWQWRRRQA